MPSQISWCAGATWSRVSSGSLLKLPPRLLPGRSAIHIAEHTSHTAGKLAVIAGLVNQEGGKRPVSWIVGAELQVEAISRLNGDGITIDVRLEPVTTIGAHHFEL